MDYTLTKSVSHFLTTQVLRDDYLIIDEPGEYNLTAAEDAEQAQLPFQAKLGRLQSLCIANDYLCATDVSLATWRLVHHYEQTQTIPSSLEIVERFLPHSIVRTNKQHFGRQQDHAQLIKQVSAATQGCWSVNGADSRQDRKDNCWVIAYKGQHKSETFRFAQQGDELDAAFLTWLVASAERKSGYRISSHGTDKHLCILCLPAPLHSLLIDNDAALLAA